MPPDPPKPGATRRPASLREAFAYLDWLFNPFSRIETTRVYDLLSTRAATRDGLYLNLGYWREARQLDEACDALAALVAETGGMGPGDEVLDVGYGFGDQDLYWMRRYRPARITGLNITASQVRVAQDRMREAGLADRIDLRQGSATCMPIPEASCDLVIALECAFHFRTREAFFAEAMRVLRPAGRLVSADIIPTAPVDGIRTSGAQRASWGLIARKFDIPRANAYGREAYADKLGAAGFGEIEVRSIRDAVYAPLHLSLRADPAPIRRLHPLVRPVLHAALLMDPGRVYAGLDYVLARAVKPAGAREL